MRKQNLSGSERGLEAVLEHKQIMEAIRQKDADRERFNNVLNAVAIGAAAFAVTLLVICFVL